MSLRLKMILGIGAILLLVILVFAILASGTQVDHARTMARHEAELIAAVADRALANAMEAGERDVVRAILRRMGEHPEVAGMRIVDPEWAIHHSSRPAEIGRILAERDRPPEGKVGEPVWDLQRGAVAVFRPIPNRPSCAGCHPQDRPILGFLNVQVWLPSGAAEDGRWTVVIPLAIACLVAAGGLIWLFFAFAVGRRIEDLAGAMGQVEAGDLSARAEADEHDELGRLGRSFNAMVARLADAHRQLEDRHAEEVRRAETLASLGKMAAGIAHEINNPIAGMQNCVRTLLKGARHEGQRVQYLLMLQEGLGRIGRIVGQLLNFARETRTRPTPTEIPPLLRRCMALLEHELTTRRITCDLRVDGGLPVPLADAHQMEQVFLNVLMNAVEAMPEGGALTISAGVRQRGGSPFVEVRVADTGVGIPPEHLPRIFDPFFTTKEVGRGTGLGLSVSYGIVRSHGGFIDVESAVGKGTAVAVVLPVNGG